MPRRSRHWSRLVNVVAYRSPWKLNGLVRRVVGKWNPYCVLLDAPRYNAVLSNSTMPMQTVNANVESGIIALHSLLKANLGLACFQVLRIVSLFYMYQSQLHLLEPKHVATLENCLSQLLMIESKFKRFNSKMDPGLFYTMQRMTKKVLEHIMDSNDTWSRADANCIVEFAKAKVKMGTSNHNFTKIVERVIVNDGVYLQNPQLLDCLDYLVHNRIANRGATTEPILTVLGILHDSIISIQDSQLVRILELCMKSGVFHGGLLHSATERIMDSKRKPFRLALTTVQVLDDAGCFEESWRILKSLNVTSKSRLTPQVLLKLANITKKHLYDTEAHSMLLNILERMHYRLVHFSSKEVAQVATVLSNLLHVPYQYMDPPCKATWIYRGGFTNFATIIQLHAPVLDVSSLAHVVIVYSYNWGFPHDKCRGDVVEIVKLLPILLEYMCKLLVKHVPECSEMLKNTVGNSHKAAALQGPIQAQLAPTVSDLQDPRVYNTSLKANYKLIKNRENTSNNALVLPRAENIDTTKLDMTGIEPAFLFDFGEGRGGCDYGLVQLREAYKALHVFNVFLGHYWRLVPRVVCMQVMQFLRFYERAIVLLESRYDNIDKRFTLFNRDATYSKRLRRALGGMDNPCRVDPRFLCTEGSMDAVANDVPENHGDVKIKNIGARLRNCNVDGIKPARLLRGNHHHCIRHQSLSSRLNERQAIATKQVSSKIDGNLDVIDFYDNVYQGITMVPTATNAMTAANTKSRLECQVNLALTSLDVATRTQESSGPYTIDVLVPQTA